MRANKSPRRPAGLFSPTGIVRLITHALMGAALGLAFGLTLILSNPAVASLLNHGGDSAAIVLILMLVTTFAIGATLTGIVFIITEDKEF